MQINKTAKIIKKVVINPEGSIVFGRKPEIQLYLEASNLKLTTDEFYQSADVKLKNILSLANSIDEDYVFNLAQFLTDSGLKLSPVVLYSVLSHRGFSYRNNCNPVIKTFNTPQRIAEAIALNNIGVTLNNSFKVHVLKQALNQMSPMTLKKNKMLNREIKLRDLIKLLRPTPTSDYMSVLYKSIIENSKESKLQKDESVVAMKSSNAELSEKKEYYDKNIDKMPINALIRNLKFIAENFDFKQNVKLQTEIIDKLTNVKDYRFLNVFDVITAAVFVPQLEKALFEVVKKFVQDVKEKFSYNEDATILFDFSGSMFGKGMEDGFKYLVLMTLLYNDVKLRHFSNSLGVKALPDVIKNIKNGNFANAKKLFDNYEQKYNGGTALLQSTRDLLNEDAKIKNLIIISDEVSWKEGQDLRSDIKEISNLTNDKKVILVNPTVYEGTVFNDNLVGIASLTSGILYNIMIGVNANGFISFIKNYGKQKE